MAIEINMRLDVKGRRFCEFVLKEREQIAVAYLEQYGRVKHRTRTLWKGPLVRLVARVDVDAIAEDELHHLASLMMQECLCVYYPARNEGLLIGPKADQWKAFDLVEFDRFDASLNLKAMGAVPYVKEKYVPSADPAVVAAQMDALYARMRQVFTPTVRETLVHQQVNMAMSAIGRVLDNDGPDALTIPRLEGIYELVTEHLWCDAMTRVAHSLPQKPQ